jgi:hypothetical protein
VLERVHHRGRRLRTARRAARGRVVPERSGGRAEAAAGRGRLGVDPGVGGPAVRRRGSAGAGSGRRRRWWTERRRGARGGRDFRGTRPWPCRRPRAGGWSIWVARSCARRWRWSGCRRARTGHACSSRLIPGRMGPRICCWSRKGVSSSYPRHPFPPTHRLHDA